MSWLSQEDDDWLQDAPANPINLSGLSHPDSSFHYESIDLTSNDLSEPQHALPEAPACQIRMS